MILGTFVETADTLDVPKLDAQKDQRHTHVLNEYKLACRQQTK